MLAHGRNSGGLHVKGGMTMSGNGCMSVANKSISSVPHPSRGNSKTKNSTFLFNRHRKHYRGFIAGIKEAFGFIETIGHTEQVFFHFGNYVGNPEWLELGQEVGYTLSANDKIPETGNCLPARKVFTLPKGSIPQPTVLDPVHYGVVARPMRCINPQQREYAGLIKVFDEGKCIVLSQHEFGITSLIRKRALPQKGDMVRFRIDEAGWTAEVAIVRPKTRATVDSIKGPFGFLNYNNGDGKKLFFNISEFQGDAASLRAGDTVEFSVITNQKSGKSSALDVSKIGPHPDCLNLKPNSNNLMPRNEKLTVCDILKLNAPPERLMSCLKLNTDNSLPRVIATRAPRGPQGKGFLPHFRNSRIPGILPE